MAGPRSRPGQNTEGQNVRPARILVDNSSYHLRNLGDVAMLEVALQRLSNVWPGAMIQVVTKAPELLAKHFSAATPVEPGGRKRWLEWVHVPGNLERYVPRAIRGPVKAVFKVPRRDGLLGRSIINNPALGRRITRAYEFVEAVTGAEIVVCGGGGFLTDEFAKHSEEVLDLLGAAMKLGKRTALFGQGIGPVASKALKNHAAGVLPFVDFISLREGRYGAEFLRSIGVPMAKVMVTGDDAIEPAYRNRGASLGGGIGINVRAAAYSAIELSEIRDMGETIRRAARQYHAPLVPLPISFLDGESDVRSVFEVLGREHPTEDYGTESLPATFERIRACRVVVTGSYHAGVFALAQGVSVIALAKSSYYLTKFLGLAGQFGTGCKVVSVEEVDWQNKLADAIRKSWHVADKVRPAILNASLRQIEASRAAYARFYESVTTAPSGGQRAADLNPGSCLATPLNR